MNFRISNNIIVAVLCAICFGLPGRGQTVVELEKTVDEISQTMGLLKGDISSIFSVSDLFTSSADDAYKKKLKELTSIKFDRTAGEYLRWIKANNYTAKSLESDKFWQKGNSTWNRKVTASDVSYRRLDAFGDGKSKEKLEAYKGRQVAALNNLSIENAFPAAVKDMILGNLTSEEKRLLDMDLKLAPILINFFSRYPETIKTYQKLIKSDYRRNPGFLYFWTYDFQTEPNGLKKNEIIDPEAMSFDQVSDGRLMVKNGDRQLAAFTAKKMEVYDPVLLSYTFPPDHTVSFNNLTFETDNLGRLASIQLRVVSKSEKKEKIHKSKMYDIKKFNKSKPDKYAFLIPEKINGYKVLQNAFNLDDKRYKRLLKYIEKSYSIAQKQGRPETMVYDFQYASGDYEPTSVEVELLSPIETKKLTYGQKIRLDFR